MKNPIKALAIINTALLVVVVVVVIYAAVNAKTESGENVNFFGKRDEDREEASEA